MEVDDEGLVHGLAPSDNGLFHRIHEGEQHAKETFLVEYGGLLGQESADDGAALKNKSYN